MAASAVANTILSQIPVGVRMSLGARDYLSVGDKLAFSVGRNRIAHVELNSLDLYDVTIGRQKRGTYEWIAEVERTNIYAEDLGETLIRSLDESGEGR